MERPGVRQVPEGSGEQGKMEKTGCKIICGAPTTLAVKGLMMIDDDDDVFYVFDINQTSLSTFFPSVLVSVSVFTALSTAFNKFSQQLSAFSLCSSGLTFALLVLLTLYLFIKIFSALI